jgi:DNA polymerase V
LFLVSVSAGFPSPADDYLEGKLDFNEHLIKHESATFFVKVKGDSMIGSGIHSGDLLIVDRALEPTDNSVVIAIVNGELTVKRISKQEGKLSLVPDNGNYRPIPITEWFLAIFRDVMRSGHNQGDLVDRCHQNSIPI